ncbi:helix-turn-helix domain-containing protein [Flavisolibacter ginsenosidimutans]|uniref:XRE family transcriptional regulator n=1 Tax=Flavisolibacter ginsenosidimutans TaxID=661481 RepID=A0A5B8UM14_9BACT|nr:XRE family transcriptional regulator [Flavisolibacter ginsenosidimutans]QEC57219.1 XRE family transcriptional regulator [Flavisolibacter ginsenosidimutans]
MKQWSIIENETQYKAAKERFEEIYEVDKTSPDFHEMMLLALLINQYEKKQFSFPSVDPIEMIKIRMEDFDYKPADLAKAYGDKGTISKVLNYKQPLSLNMIRLFSKMLRIPADALIKEYKLQ